MMPKLSLLARDKRRQRILTRNKHHKAGQTGECYLHLIEASGLNIAAELYRKKYSLPQLVPRARQFYPTPNPESQFVTAESTAAASFCAVAPAIVMPSATVALAQRERSVDSLEARPLPAWVENGRMVLPAQFWDSRKVYTGMGISPHQMG